ncbi:MAG: efflux RND transporter periplasmic adaptor subunit [Flavobacteriaceae bacterium]|nr:efflux RND transporter periplasmic adaptor subunit [Flavobacteriaceae bacterium]
MKHIFWAGGLSLMFFYCSEPQELSVEEYQISEEENKITLNDIQMKNTGIRTSSLENKEMAIKIIVSGVVDVPPNAMASVSAPSGGYVRSTKFLEGNFVNKGEVLAILEDPNIVQLQQDYLLAKSNLSYAEKDFIRQKDLNESKASSDKAMQMAETEVQNQRIILNAIADKLKILEINPNGLHAGNIQRSVAIKAPISGHISSVNINLGQYVSPSDKLFEIVNTKEKLLVLRVFEKDLSKIKIGQRLWAYTNESPDKKIPADIFLISKNFEADRSVLVYCRIKTAVEHWARGTFINAEIETENHKGNSISDDAIVTWEGKQYVFEEVSSNTFKMLEIQIGNSESGYTELKNVSEDFLKKKLVYRGAYSLLMGLKNIEE